VRDSDFTKILRWPGYRVYQHEINEAAKTLRLWVRRKRRPRPLICSGCGTRVREVHDISEREVRDLLRGVNYFCRSCCLASECYPTASLSSYP